MRNILRPDVPGLPSCVLLCSFNHSRIDLPGVTSKMHSPCRIVFQMCDNVHGAVNQGSTYTHNNSSSLDDEGNVLHQTRQSTTVVAHRHKYNIRMSVIPQTVTFGWPHKAASVSYRMGKGFGGKSAGGDTHRYRSVTDPEHAAPHNEGIRNYTTVCTSQDYTRCMGAGRRGGDFCLHLWEKAKNNWICGANEVSHSLPCLFCSCSFCNAPAVCDISYHAS